jgi:hypothetical protein
VHLLSRQCRKDGRRQAPVFSLLEAVTVAFYLAVIAGSLITLDDHFKHENLSNQENTSHVARR